MATLLLAAAGSAIGSGIGGSILGFTAAGIGQAVGAIAGGLIDQRILGSGSKTVETGRARSLRLQTSTPGAPIPRVFGRMRVSGHLIWSTRFLETVRTTTQGGKATGGGATVREYSYSISFAVALCEGEISHVGRLWADGKLLDPTDLQIRVHRGADDQLPDPKIEAIEGAGAVPAFRGTAYLVFEDLDLTRFGNRIPQIAAEVIRPVARPATGPEAAPALREIVRGVALSPGTGEFALETERTDYVYPGGARETANIRTPAGRPDILVALDQLADELPACATVSLVISWFGDDLRCGRCRVEPRAEAAERTAEPAPWEVSGLTAATARLVSRDAEDRPIYGGTPTDRSVVNAIREMTARGLGVMLYPFLLMDIQAGNGLDDPYGRAEQPPFPWRGRITLDTAPGRPGSTDQTPAAADEVRAFFGTARASDFAIGDGTVTYTGPEEWTWRRFALHIAALGAAAGGVEAICIGTELRELTTLRSGKTAYPAVAELIALAAEVRLLLPAAKISYAADWSEYWGHQPGDGSGDRIFHLDPLWADANIDFIGIDDYLPLADWRHEPGHADAARAPTPHSLPYLSENMEGGEHYDWYYADDAARAAQIRTPIADTAHGEHWIFRPKDIRTWWQTPHHNRLDGVRQSAPTPWVPGSKPVWLTETGCPAVDLGANMPNLFFDPKSSESGLPPGSLGARDDAMQRRYLQAKIGHWTAPENNPTGSYGGPMIPLERIYVWTWDARPFPDWPNRLSAWSDGTAHQLGHWITGRATSCDLADVVHEISEEGGVPDADVSRLYDTVHGLLIEDTGTARAHLQPLMLAYGADARESGGRIAFIGRGQSAPVALSAEALAAGEDALGDAVRARDSAGSEADAVRLTYLEAETDYRLGAAEALSPEAAGDARRVSETSLPLALPASRAQAVAERWLAEAGRARDRISLALPPSRLALEPADLLSLDGTGGRELYRIERVTEGPAREVEAVRVDARAHLPVAAPERLVETAFTPVPGPLEAVILDLPLAEGDGVDHAPHLAVSADPWPGAVGVYRSIDGTNFEPVAEVRRPAVIGRLGMALPAGAAQLWQRVRVALALPAGSLFSRDRLAVLAGANALAVEAAPGVWEILQARDATLTGPGEITIGRLLRGRRGTEALAAAEIPAGARVVALDEAVTRLPLSLEARGLARIYRVGPATKPLDDPTYLQIDHTAGAVGLRPFSPVHLRAHRSGGDLRVAWVRRTRIGGDSWEGAEVPLGEEREAYRLRVLKGGHALREIETATPDATYLAADQLADGAVAPFEIAVSQLSTSFGPGPETRITIDD